MWELGAAHAIDTARESFVRAVHAKFGKPHMLGGGGVDVVVNYVGGETWAQALRCLGRHGRMLTCGASAGHAPATDLRFIWTYEQQILGCNGWTPDDQKAVLQLVADGELEAVVQDVRPLEGTASAIQDLADRKVVGKLVIEPQR